MGNLTTQEANLVSTIRASSGDTPLRVDPPWPRSSHGKSQSEQGPDRTRQNGKMNRVVPSKFSSGAHGDSDRSTEQRKQERSPEKIKMLSARLFYHTLAIGLGTMPTVFVLRNMLVGLQLPESPH